jgi:hypothetical protein
LKADAIDRGARPVKLLFHIVILRKRRQAKPRGESDQTQQQPRGDICHVQYGQIAEAITETTPPAM